MGKGSLRRPKGFALLNPKLVCELCLLAAFLAVSPGQAPAREALVGGPCAYDTFPGTATVISVEAIPRSRNLQDRLPYQPFRVLFTFEPSKPVSHPLYRPGQAHELTLSGGTPPGPAFLKKYGIRPGAAFRAQLHLITSGTCTPATFTLRGVDVFDQFEFKQR